MAAGRRIAGVGLAALVAVGGVLSSSPVFGQAEKASEFQIKAAYLYNFSKFVQWPAKGGVGGEDKRGDDSKASSFTICVMGKSPVASALESIVQGETVDGLPVTERTIERVEEGTGCRILYVGAPEERSVKRVLSLLEGRPVLTVSDIPNFADHGGMVEFVIEDNKVRFDVNRAAAEKAGLTLSSQLLKVAHRVGPEK